MKANIDGFSSGDQYLIPYIIFVGTIRAIVEVKHSRDARIRASKEDATLYKAITLGDVYTLRDFYQNKPMRGPSLLLGGTLLFYNLWYGDGFGGGYSIMFNAALIVYLLFVLVEKFLVHRDSDKDDYEWGYGDAWATIGLASTVMLIFSALNLGDRMNADTTVEGALVAALGAIILDVSRLGYGSRSFSEDPYEEKPDKIQGYEYAAAFVFRFVHACVGALGLISVYIQETDDSVAIGVIPSLRLFVVVASLVKIAGFFYTVFLSLDGEGQYCKFVNLVPMQKQNVENTLRQGSTIVLLIASTYLKDFKNENSLGVALFWIAAVARLFDCLQDSILEFGYNYKNFLPGNYGMQKSLQNKYSTQESLSQGQLIMSPGADNPRSWIVIGGLVTTLYLIIQVMHYENKDYTPDSADNNKILDGTANHFDGFIITALVLVIAHIVLALASVFATLAPMLNSISVSRIPLFRQSVTSVVLICLAICAGQINLGYNEVASTSPSPSVDPFTPNWSQLHLLAAIVIYIFTDMIGHVFL